MNDNFENNKNGYDGYSSDNNTADNNYQDIHSSSDSQSASTAENTESSYEWNTNSTSSVNSGEYRHSYINGNNENASHNPNRYENAYSSNTASGTSSQNYSSDSYGSQYSSNPYSSQQTNNYSYGNPSQNPYGSQSGSPYANQQYSAPKAKKVKVKKPKKPKKPASKGFVAAMLVAAIILGGGAGFGGSMLASSLNNNSSSSVNIKQASANSTSTTSNAALSGTTSEIVKKTADSVVEIATESVVTGGFAQQYVQQGAGSGVIISEDGYIITNYHVIEGAENITVTLRDGATSYKAKLIGSDEDNDIALLKIDATGLSAATMGNSSDLAVGDYVVAIGNPLGQLGGTVTDGIISALARQVTVEGKSMTLLQHNAQISPGNSGGGLFNSNGELIGIVNAKDSATEVEGIAFAIPINNVLDIIDDLKTYGYVKGKVDLGMELTDITSDDSAFYYGLSNTGCYVLSVTSGSNAEKAGFMRGDMITAVNGTSVSSKSDIETALKDSKVGDTVTFTVTRRGKTANLKLTLAEYSPSGSSSTGNSKTQNKSSQSQGKSSDNSDSDSIFLAFYINIHTAKAVDKNSLLTNKAP